MTAQFATEAVALGGVVASCWVGVLGMLRMPTPTAALHYLAVPGCVGSLFLTAAVFAATGSSTVSWKTVLITVVMLGINAVVTHATARAFRMRAIGRWQPAAEDAIARSSETEP